MRLSKLLRDWTIADVQSLVDKGIPEDSTLDYKQEINQSIAKTISAMANTYGGLVICGVECNGANNVAVKIHPVSVAKPADMVEQLCNQHIWPPVNVRTHMLNIASTDYILLVEVPQSEVTPHIYLPKDRPYVRINSESRPANYEQFQWIVEGRKKAIGFRDELKSKSLEKISSLAQGNSRRYCLGIFVSPFFPGRVLVDYQDLREQLISVLPTDIRMNVNNRSDFFAYFNDGVLFKLQYESIPLERFFGITSFGTINCLTHEGLTLQEGGPGVYLNIHIMGRRLVESLNLCGEYLKAVDFWGPLYVELRLWGIKDTELWGSPIQFFWRKKCVLEDQILGQYQLNPLEFFENRSTFMADFMSRLLHAFGVTENITSYAQSIIKDVERQLKVEIELGQWTL